MVDVEIPPWVYTLAKQRRIAREQLNYARADEIQQQIHTLGWVVQDRDGIFTIRPRKRPNVRQDDSERRQIARRKKERVRNKKARFAVFADFVVETFGHLTTASEEAGRDFRILDVAGGKARLALELALERNVPCTVVDPRIDRLSAFTSRRLINLAQEWKKTKSLTVLEKKHDFSALGLSSDMLHADSLDQNSPDDIQCTMEYFHHRGLAFHRCLFDQHYVDKRAAWTQATLVLGMHPDEATEDIVDFALLRNKSFAVVPCCVFPSLFPHRRSAEGHPVRSLEDFIAYLIAKHPDIQSTTLTAMPGCNVVVYRTVCE